MDNVLSRLIETGRASFPSTEPGTYSGVEITYSVNFSSVPAVFINPVDSGSLLQGDFAFIANDRARTGCALRFVNASDTTFAPNVSWLAIDMR